MRVRGIRLIKRRSAIFHRSLLVNQPEYTVFQNKAQQLVVWSYFVVECNVLALVPVDKDEILSACEQTVQIVVRVSVQQACCAARTHPDLRLHQPLPKSALQSPRKLE